MTSENRIAKHEPLEEPVQVFSREEALEWLDGLRKAVESADVVMMNMYSARDCFEVAPVDGTRRYRAGPRAVHQVSLILFHPETPGVPK